LIQATLAPQEAADLLFYLMNVVSTVSARYDNAFKQNHLLLYRRGLDTRYGIGTAEALEEHIAIHTSEAKQPKSGARKSTKPRSSKYKEG
jgi:hypothetical protein